MCVCCRCCFVVLVVFIALYVAVNYFKILSVAQQCFYGKFLEFTLRELCPRGRQVEIMLVGEGGGGQGPLNWTL